MANIGSLVAYLELNAVKFEQSLGNATQMAEGAMKRIEGASALAKAALGGLAGALTVGGMVAFVKKTIESTAALKDMSENTNVSVEKLSALQKVAKQSGQDFDSVVTGLQKLSRQMVAAAGGSKEAQKSFSTFGISAQEVKSKLDDPAGMMLLLAQRMDGFNRSAIKSDAMMALMGKGGANLGKYMQELAEKTELVGSRTTAQAEAAEKFEKALRRLSEGVNKLVMPLVLDLLPALEKLLPLIKTVAELTALWFVAFVAGPKVIAAVVAVFAGLVSIVQTAGLAFKVADTWAGALTMRLSGTSVSAQAASGMMGALTVTAGLLFAAFAGWKIGEYLRENFVEVQLAGNDMARGLMKAWEAVKFGFETAINGMSGLWYAFIQGMGDTLSSIPGFGIAGKALSEQGAIGLQQLAVEQAAAATEYARAIAEGNKIFDEMDRETLEKFANIGKAAEKKRKDLSVPPDKSGMEAYRKELDALLNRLEGNESGFNAKFYHELAILNKEFGSKNPERYQRLMTELVKSTDYGKKIFKDAAEAAKAHNDAVDAAYDVLEKERMAVENGIKGFRDKAEAIEFETTLIGLSSAAREKALILHELEAKKVGLSAEAYAELSDKVKGLLDRINSAAGQRNALADAMEQQVGFWKSLENVAHQTWTSITDGGKGIWQRIKDTAKNVFFDWLYQLTLKKWMINLVTSASGVGVAEQVFGASAVRSAGDVTSAYNAVSNVGGKITSAGNLFGSSNVSAYGTGFSLGTSGSAEAVAAYMESADAAFLAGNTAYADTLYGVADSLTAGATAAEGTLGSIAGAAPYIAAALVALEILSSLDDSGTPHQGGFGSYSAAGGLKTGGAAAAPLGDWSGWGWNESRGDYVDQVNQSSGMLAQGITSILDGAAKQFGLKGGYTTTTGFADDSSGDGAWGALKIVGPGGTAIDWGAGRTSGWAPKEFSDGKAGQDQYAAALATSTRDALYAMDLPAWVDKVLGDLGKSPNMDQLGAAVTKIGQLQSVAARLAPTLNDVVTSIGEVNGAAVTLDGVMGQLIALGDAGAAMLGLLDATTQLGNVFEDVRLAGLSTASVYRYQTDALQGLTAAYDGSLDSSQKLGTLMQARYQSEMQLLQQVDAMIKGIHASTVSAAEGYLVDTLDAQGKYNFYDRGMDSALAMIKVSTDPEVINTYAQKYIGYMNAAWATLTPEQKLSGLAGFQTAAQTLDTTVTAQGGSISAGITAENSALATAIKTAVADAVKEAFAPVTEGMVNAVNTPLKVESSVDISITTSPGLEASVQ